MNEWMNEWTNEWMNNLLTENSKTSNGHAGPEWDTNTHPMKHKKEDIVKSMNKWEQQSQLIKVQKINHQNQRQ